jgi:hypothetical protein
MVLGVIDPNDVLILSKPTFDFTQRHHGRGIGIVGSTLLGTRERRTGQLVQRAHKRSQRPLDMTTQLTGAHHHASPSIQRKRLLHSRW